MQGKLLSGGAFKDKSCRKDVLSGGAFKYRSGGKDVFSGGAFKDKSCREDIFSGGAFKDQVCGPAKMSISHRQERHFILTQAFGVGESAPDGHWASTRGPKARFA